MSKIINYSSGGLCNRLLPIASCLAYKRKNPNTEIIVCWNPTFRCHCKFDDLFEVDGFSLCGNDELKNHHDVEGIYLPGTDMAEAGWYVNYDAQLYGDFSLLEFNNCHMEKIKSIQEETFTNSCVFYTNTFAPQLATLEETINELRNLTILPHIQDKIDSFVEQHGIDKSWTSYHARGTDFEQTRVEHSIEHIRGLIQQDPNSKIMLTSDEPSWENKIKETFPDNVIFREKKSVITRASDDRPTWNSNCMTDIDSVIDALIDIHILSRCGAFYSNTEESSFSKTIEWLGTDGNTE
jgi:hypothetical protein